MTHTTIKTLAILAALGVFASISGGAAQAGTGGKEYFSQTYQTNQSMKGVEGSQGNFYCSYRNTPIRKCDANGHCKVVGNELFQHCY